MGSIAEDSIVVQRQRASRFQRSNERRNTERREKEKEETSVETGKAGKFG